MGSALGKNKQQARKNKIGKNALRYPSSTVSLPDDIGVNSVPNPYLKNEAPDRHRNNSDASPGTRIQPCAPPLPLRSRQTVLRAMYDYAPRYTDDLAFRKGDKMELISNEGNEDWWLVRNVVTRKQGYVPSNYVVIDDNSIESQEWWFGSDRAEANKQLVLPGNPRGTFLIRNSKTGNAFALSVADRSEHDEVVIRHYLIRKMDNGGVYIHGSTTFQDLFHLVKYYSGKSAGLKCRLTTPCPKELLAVPFKQLEVRRKDIAIGKRLGAGNFGEVHSGVFRNVVDVAVKSLKPGSMSTMEFLGEAQIMHKLRHPKLVQLMGVCTEEQPLWIITELMSNGALIEFLRKDMGETIKFPVMMDIAAQIAHGMSYLEEKNFIHRDLRAANILVGDNFIVKVADFGLARILDGIYGSQDDIYKGSENTKFPIKWTAPEAARQFRFTVKSDVWSFGILIYELITFGRIPYPDMDNTSTLTRVLEGYRMPKPVSYPVPCPDELYNIMLDCWHKRPEQRPTFDFLKGFFEDYQVSTEASYTQDIS